MWISVFDFRIEPWPAPFSVDVGADERLHGAGHGYTIVLPDECGERRLQEHEDFAIEVTPVWFVNGEETAHGFWSRCGCSAPRQLPRHGDERDASAAPFA